MRDQAKLVLFCQFILSRKPLFRFHHHDWAVDAILSKYPELALPTTERPEGELYYCPKANCGKKLGGQCCKTHFPEYLYDGEAPREESAIVEETKPTTPNSVIDRPEFLAKGKGQLTMA